MSCAIAVTTQTPAADRPKLILDTDSANEIDDLIDGVTLKLVGADPGQEITVDVSRDAEVTKTAVTDFVAAYNGLMQSIDDQVRFDAETGQAADNGAQANNDPCEEINFTVQGVSGCAREGGDCHNQCGGANGFVQREFQDESQRKQNHHAAAGAHRRTPRRPPPHP